MGKYSAVMKARGLEPLPPEPGDRQDRIETIKAELVGKSGAELSREYVKLRREKAIHEREGKKVQERLDAVEQLGYDTLEAEGTTGLKLDGGIAVGLDEKPYARVTDKVAFRKWCVEQGFGDQLQLWPATTQAVVKERMLNGDPDPPGVAVWIKRSLTARGLKE